MLDLIKLDNDTVLDHGTIRLSNIKTGGQVSLKDIGFGDKDVYVFVNYNYKDFVDLYHAISDYCIKNYIYDSYDIHIDSYCGSMTCIDIVINVSKPRPFDFGSDTVNDPDINF